MVRTYVAWLEFEGDIADILVFVVSAEQKDPSMLVLSMEPDFGIEELQLDDPRNQNVHEEGYNISLEKLKLLQYVQIGHSQNPHYNGPGGCWK